MMSDVEFLNYCESKAKNEAESREVKGSKYNLVTFKGNVLNRLYTVAEVTAPKKFEKDAEVEVESSMISGLVNQAWEVLRAIEAPWVKKSHVYNQV